MGIFSRGYGIYASEAVSGEWLVWHSSAQIQWFATTVKYTYLVYFLQLPVYSIVESNCSTP